MAEKTREKDAKELADLQEANRVRRETHRPTEVHTTVAATNAKGEPVEVELHAFGGTVYLNSHGEARLDPDQAADLQKKAVWARLAVS